MTEEKNTEQLISRVNYLESLLEHMGKSQVILEFDLQGKFLFANRFFQELFAYSLEELKGNHYSILISEKLRESPEQLSLWANLNKGEDQSGDYIYQDKHDREICLSATFHVICNDSGTPIKIIVHAINITQYKYILKTVATNADELSEASSGLSAASQYMSSSAEETSIQANVVAAAAEQVNRNIEVVTTGADEMTYSIKEIAMNAHDAARVATNAVKAAAQTNQIVSKLGDSSGEVGKVIRVITSIAQQTKLLALNATIEAARAGEAGKGFAVVANEVKELAKETATATEDISEKIAAIQADTQSAVEAIAEIQNIINQINDYQNTIASAVEEQAATTSEIGRNIAEAAKGSHEIAKNISGVAEAAQSTAAGAGEAQMAVDTLTKMADSLKKLVKEFGYS